MKKKKINEIFQVEKGDIISIVGSGGKTSLMFELSKELKNDYKVLVTTSTKIYKPPCEYYDYLYISIEEYRNTNINKMESNSNYKKNSATVLAKKIDSNSNKLIGINNDELKSVINDFDVVLIEADGSRNLPLKGWKKDEPPILASTNKTIAVLPMDVINKEINEDFIYGYEEFKEIVGEIPFLDFEAVGKLCLNKLGMFKNSRGNLYLYLNKADNDELVNEAYQLAMYLEKKIKEKYCNFDISYGSLKRGEFYEH